MKSKLKIAGGLVLSLLFFYLTCFYYVKPQSMDITWNPFTGELKADTVPGYYCAAPWVMATRLDLRPARVCITTTANSYSCKLVMFNPSGWMEFVRVQGFQYYWWKNRISFNLGYSDEYRGFRDILRGYAYGNKDYDFIIIKK